MTNWLKQKFWYIANFLNKILRKNKMILPTINNEGNFIDKNRVSNVIKFTKNGITYFYAIVDNEPVWLIHSPELELWFIDSGVIIVSISGEPENICTPQNVTNIPKKYFDIKTPDKNSPKPK